MNLFKLLSVYIILFLAFSGCTQKDETEAPNILFVITDDQSYPHAGAYGAAFVNTPAFDRVAREGILFENCIAASPSCSPSRAAILTGRNIWQLEEAGSHISSFPRKFTTFTELLEKQGYLVGFTGKGWAPGNWKDSGWKRNPVGDAYQEFKNDPPASGISNCDYTANFFDFLKKRKKKQPFFFWCGMYEPHRGYEFGSGAKAGKSPEQARVPEFLYDDDRTRNDLLDYAFEIEWADNHLEKMLQHLKEIGELDNTIVVVTSDNGMPFPRAKVQVYEYGIHVPLAIRWGDRISPNRKVTDFIGFNDLAPTFLDLAGVHDSLPEMSGHSFVNVLLSEKSGRVDPTRTYALAGKERHNYARANNMGYPIRGLRNDHYLYLRNFRPERWPSGDPDLYRDSELDKVSGESIMELKATDSTASRLFHLNVDKRPSEELYDIVSDPACLHNLAANPEYIEVVQDLGDQLIRQLTLQNDPRVVDQSDIFDSYPTFHPNILFDKNGQSLFPGFAEYGKYNPKFQ